MGNRRDAARGHGESRQRELRARIANEAARLITEDGLRDYAHAARKAAERLGSHDEAALPRGPEIEEALREYQRLFRREEQPRTLRQMREAALQAMDFLASFEPRLVGSVLDGTADRHATVGLHAFSDEPLALAHFLGERRIPYREDTRRLRFERDEPEAFPTYRFDAEGITFDLTLLPLDRQRAAPLDRDTDRPMRRANRAAVVELLRDDEP